MKTYSLENLRRGAASFLAGRVATGLLGLLNFTLLARVLHVENYATYVGLIAALELAIAFSTFGIDWVGLRYIPESREMAQPAQFDAFVNELVLLRCAAAVAVALVLYAISRVVLVWFGLQHLATLVSLYVGIVLVCEAAWRFLGGVVFDSLLLQGYAQLVQFARSATLALALIFFITADPALQLQQVALAECAASLLACALAVALYRWAQSPKRSQARSVPDGGWMPPPPRQLLRTAWHNYSSVLVSQTYSPAMMQTIVNATLAPATAAAFGFARTSVDLFRRYLPSELFAGLFRPMLLARYARSGDFAALNSGVMSIYKVSLLALATASVLFLTLGPELIELVSADKYAATYPLILALLLVSASWIHRRMLMLVVNAVDATRLWSRVAAICMLVLPLAVIAVHTPLGVYGVLAAIAMEEVLSTLLLLRGLRKAGVIYRINLAFLGKTLASCVAAALVFIAMGPYGLSVLDSAVRACCALCVFILVTIWWRPFDASELPMFRKLVGAARS